MFEPLVRKKFLKTLQQTEYGSITIETPEGEIFTFEGHHHLEHKADIKLYDWRVTTNLAFKGDVGFAADYRDGYWTTSNLAELINFGLKNDKIFQSYGNGNFFYKCLGKLLYFTKRNTLGGSKRNIHDHYDLGNDFYKLWLDPSMTYSSAIFSHPEQNLTLAQFQKYDRILNKINSRPGTILEIGCGWGGFAERATAHHHIIKGITLSHEQAKFAKERLKHTNANIAIEDYRNQTGLYDYIVSIEMFEAVGKQYWPIFFKKLKQLLKPNGRILLQTITIADELYKEYTKSTDMIRTYIFPGGMLPSEQILHNELKKVGLACRDIYRFGQDYALTLKLWLNQFEEKKPELSNLGFKDDFIRLWQFYLASCSATFKSQRINVVQMEIAHA